LAHLHPPVDGVELVRWPEEAHRADDLHARGLPCVLLVAREATPPRIRDELEDWVRLPAPAADVEVRARRLAQLATTRPSRAGGGVRA
jgi:hypothetical protein